jgi:hypothetical protein
MDFAPIMGPAKYGIDPLAPASNAPTALASTVTPSEHGAGGVVSKDNPFTAFAVLAALTFGLMAFSTTVRVGKTSANLSVGSTS